MFVSYSITSVQGWQGISIFLSTLILTYDQLRSRCYNCQFFNLKSLVLQRMMAWMYRATSAEKTWSGLATTSFPGFSPTRRVGENPGNKVGLAIILTSWALFRLFPSCLKPLFQGEAKCEAINMKIFFILMQILSFSQQRLCTSPRFESENLWNSEWARFLLGLNY